MHTEHLSNWKAIFPFRGDSKGQRIRDRLTDTFRKWFWLWVMLACEAWTYVSLGWQHCCAVCIYSCSAGTRYPYLSSFPLPTLSHSRMAPYNKPQLCYGITVNCAAVSQSTLQSAYIRCHWLGKRSCVYSRLNMKWLIRYAFDGFRARLGVGQHSSRHLVCVVLKKILAVAKAVSRSERRGHTSNAIFAKVSSWNSDWCYVLPRIFF